MTTAAIGGGTVGKAAGGLAGRWIGGVIGSLAGPLGTAAGQWLGAKAGALAGQMIGEALANSIDDANEDAENLADATAAAEEEVCTDCGEDPCEHLRDQGEPGDNRGGAHKDMQKPSRDGKDSHHMPMRGSYEGTGMDPELGPAIQMPQAQHRMLPSSRGGQAAHDLIARQNELMRQGRMTEAFDLGADEVREMFDDEFDDAIERARAYAECRDEHGGGTKGGGSGSPPASGTGSGTPGPPATS